MNPLTAYSFQVPSGSNTDQNSQYLSDRINNESLFASAIFVGVSYDSVPNAVITFVNPLDNDSNELLSNIIQAIYYESYAGSSYQYPNPISVPSRNVTNMNFIPNSLSDMYAGYNIGSQVFNNTTNILYTCLDATPNQAVWLDQVQIL